MAALARRSRRSKSENLLSRGSSFVRVLGGVGLVPPFPGSCPFCPMSEYIHVRCSVLIVYPLRSISASCLLSLGESSQAKDPDIIVPGIGESRIRDDVDVTFATAN